MESDKWMLKALRELLHEAEEIRDNEPVEHVQEFYPQGEDGFYEDEEINTERYYTYDDLVENLRTAIVDFEYATGLKGEKI